MKSPAIHKNSPQLGHRLVALLFFAASFLLFSAQETGCRKNTRLEGPQSATSARSTSFLKKKLNTHDRANVVSANAQAKIFVEGEGQSMGATANIIWVRDSAMWLNIKKLGFEVARALITRDSVFVLNRLEKTYSVRALESLQRQYSLPAGFELVQSLLLASPWFSPDIQLETDVKDGYHRLSGSNGRFAADYRIEESAFWLRQEIFLQPREARTVSAKFDNYKKTALAGWFPYLRTVEAFSPETGNLRLSVELNDVEFNVPKSFRFEIPKHYERMD